MSLQNKQKRSNTETIKTDVIVIGAGGGLAAAVASAESGAKVLVMERRRKAGGNIAMARGFLAAESPVQRRLKIDTSRKHLFDTTMGYAHWRIDPKIVKAFIDKTGDTVRWLEDMGIAFTGVPHSFYNQFPRIYHIPEGQGSRLVKVLAGKCEILGVKILNNTRATEILLNKQGEAIGVEALENSSKEKIRISSKSVIIATGGYSGNKDLLKKYYPHYTDKLHLYGLPNMGDGLNMAVNAGAATEGLGTVLTMGPFFQGSLYVHAVSQESNTVWVNSKGERFINENSEVSSYTANALDRQPENVCYSLFDESIKQGFIKDGLIKAVDSHYPVTTRMTELDRHLSKDTKEGNALISGSLKEIAAWIGAEYYVLKNTIDDYNTCCEQKYDHYFYKDSRCLQPLLTPPYYVLRCGQAFHGTIGGIKINHRMEVVNTQDHPIPGLFAMGNDAGGWVGESYCYILTGSALAFALNSGRIAGENAAAYVSGRCKQGELSPYK